jgi:hypothetical protein
VPDKRIKITTRIREAKHESDPIPISSAPRHVFPLHDAGYTSHEGGGWHVTSDDRACRNDRSLPDGYTLENRCAEPDPHMVSDHDRARYRPSSIDCVVITISYHDIFGNEYVLSNLDLIEAGNVDSIID